MNQQLSNKSDLTENEEQLFQKLEFARQEYQGLSYRGQLPLAEPKTKRLWVPLGIAASIVAVIIFTVSIQSNNVSSVKPRLTASKIDVPINFSSRIYRTPSIDNKKISLFAHKPQARAKFKTKFSMPVRPSRQST
ncbi:MAG: hypothetical protein MI865_12475 [Proteobacteria bacterium]|nr:hypothetical protein [Pseudomonadota bacterium]